MDIRKLQIFTEVAKQESFTKAAKCLYMTQPAISKAILELEKEANTALFERFPKKVVLTPAGRKLLHKVEPFLSMHDEMQKSFVTLETNSTIRIGSSITIASEQLCEIIHQLQQQFPDLHIEVEVAIVPVILEKLDNNEIDIAFVEGVINKESYHSIPFSSYTIHPVCSKAFYETHPVKHVSDLVKQPLLLREKGSAIRDIIDSVFLLNDYTLHPAWTSTNSNVLLQAALQNFGIAFLPSNMIEKKLKDKKLVEIKLPKLKLENINHLVYKPQKYISEPFAYLIQLAKSF